MTFIPSSSSSSSSGSISLVDCRSCINGVEAAWATGPNAGDVISSGALSPNCNGDTVNNEVNCFCVWGFDCGTGPCLGLDDEGGFWVLTHTDSGESSKWTSTQDTSSCPTSGTWTYDSGNVPAYEHDITLTFGAGSYGSDFVNFANCTFNGSSDATITFSDWQASGFPYAIYDGVDCYTWFAIDVAYFTVISSYTVADPGTSNLCTDGGCL